MFKISFNENLKNKIKAMLLGFLAFLVLIFLLEIACYLKPNLLTGLLPKTNITQNYKFNSEFYGIKIPAPPPIPNAYSRKKVTLPDCSTLDIEEKKKYIYPSDAFYQNNLINTLKPNIQIHNSKYSFNGKEVYNVTYSIDEFSRRKINIQNKKFENYISFIDGSIIFGEGIQDGFTIPELVYKELNNFRPYNYGIPSYGLVPNVYAIKHRNLKEEIKESNGIAFYFFYDFDIERMIPTLNYVNQRYIKRQPVAIFNNNSFKLKSFNSSDVQSKIFFLKILAKSNILKSLNINFPVIDDQDINHFVLLLESLKKHFSKQKKNHFYVIASPTISKSYFAKIKPYLENKKINYIDFSEWRIDDYLENHPTFPCDGHPTEEANIFFAKEIAKVIKQYRLLPVVSDK